MSTPFVVYAFRAEADKDHHLALTASVVDDPSRS
jgi:hypothetical protein